MKTIYQAFELIDITSDICPETEYSMGHSESLILKPATYPNSRGFKEITRGSEEEVVEELEYHALRGLNYIILPVLTFD